MKKPILVTTGEPAGIGPDICIMAAKQQDHLVFVGDREVLQARAKRLKIDLLFKDYQPHQYSSPGEMIVYHLPYPSQVVPGIMLPENAKAVLDMLVWSGQKMMAGEFSALVTAPVNKAQIQRVDASFRGHTEFFQQCTGASNVVMMLGDFNFKVALVTTHLPLKEVPQAINQAKIIDIVETLHQSLIHDFAIQNPRIAIAGLNPHAGENGVLGCEEIDTIIPAVQALQKKGVHIFGPFSADTMYLKESFDVFLAMYHDQGLSVLKYATFGKAANITLGLPIIRTSVDHGTALDIAGTHRARPDSLITAIEMAKAIRSHRDKI